MFDCRACRGRALSGLYLASPRKSRLPIGGFRSRSGYISKSVQWSLGGRPLPLDASELAGVDYDFLGDGILLSIPGIFDGIAKWDSISLKLDVDDNALREEFVFNFEPC
ncbi:MAG: hypothetical protein ACI92G_003543 [Candidatus Pelagisphaera sp.]|jgi:hypothetical protein